MTVEQQVQQLLEDWPSSWARKIKHLETGREIVKLMTPFVAWLLEQRRADKTLKRHFENLHFVGARAISMLERDPFLERKSARQLLYQALDVIPYLLGNESYARRESLLATVAKLRKFVDDSILPPPPARPARSPRQVFQFKVTLLDVKPPIWRRIQLLGDSIFWDLHVAIQDAMGWWDCHLHEFSFTCSDGVELTIGIQDDEAEGQPDMAGWEVRLDRVFPQVARKVRYTYDFGDNWVHEVRFEKAMPRERRVRYPRNIAGRRACPPEDCGGPWGYRRLLEALADPSHEEHEEFREWVGGEFDPERFNATEVEFTNPRERLNRLLYEE